MSKPTTKKPKPSKARVVRDLTKLAKDWSHWLAAGLPRRPNITPAQLAARIAVTKDAIALLKGKPA